jgi:uncharacterized protein YndB with AHSA1/START domain
MSELTETVAVVVHSPFRRSVHAEIVIEAPAERVWQVLTDFKTLPTWSKSLQGIEGELRKDADVVVMFMNNKGKVAPYKHRLTIFEAGKKFGWSDSFFPMLKDHHIYSVEPLPGGRTRFIQTDAAIGFSSLFLGKMATDFMSSNYREFNRVLKAVAEKKR